MSVSAVLIVKNEEKNIVRCLESLQWADEIILVDGHSQDRTLELAKPFKVRTFQRTFDDFSSQKNYGIQQASGEWILSIDADEVVSPELRESLLRTSQDPSSPDGSFVTRFTYIFGKILHFGGQGGERILRFFRRTKGRFERPIHETVTVAGSVGDVTGPLYHYSTGSFDEYFAKMKVYTDLEARWLLEKGAKPRHYHFWLMPVLRFLYFYGLKIGFLDGIPGLQFHALSSYYYFVKYRKLKALQKEG
jgi:glycosyltransferase involved in cell wall biosynthesis